MSRPRRPLGPQPGRLVAVMLRALIAELCEPRRYARAKEYARDDAVIDIEIRPRRVVGSVQGSRREPYVATIEIDPADPAALATAGAPDARTGALNALLPSPDELAVACTCPDFEPGRLCKHAAAVLLVLTDELTIEPTLLVRWRSPGPDPLPPLDGASDDELHDVPSSTSAGTADGAASRDVVRLPGRRAEAQRQPADDRPAPHRQGIDGDGGEAASAPPARVDPLAGTFELRQPLPALPTPGRFDMVRWLTSATAGSPTAADELLIDCATILGIDAPR